MLSETVGSGRTVTLLSLYLAEGNNDKRTRRWLLSLSWKVLFSVWWKQNGISQRFIEMTAITSNKLSFFSSRYKWVCIGAWKMFTRHVSELGWLIQMYLSSWLHPAEWQMWRYVQNSLFLSYSQLLPTSFAFKCEKCLVFFGSLQFWTVATSL